MVIGTGDFTGRMYVWMWATKNIKKGEELYYNYGEEYWEGKTYGPYE